MSKSWEWIPYGMNNGPIGDILRSEEMAEALKQTAAEITARLPAGYKVEIRNAGTRVTATIGTDTAEAIRDNLRNNSLLKAIGRG